MLKPSKFANKNLLSNLDISYKEFINVLKLSRKFKNKDLNIEFKNKVLGLIFDKSSTRTRVSFQVAMSRLGGTIIDLNPTTSQIGRGEPIKDTARVLSRYCDVLAIRTFNHSDLEEYAKWSSKPVINALTDLEHPCQAIADFLTIEEEFFDFRNVVITFIGDGNNVANSLIFCGALLNVEARSHGAHITGSSPEGLRDVLGVNAYVIRGDLSALELMPFSIGLGMALAKRLGVDIGDPVEVVVPRLLVTPLGIFPRYKRLTVSAIFEVGAQPDMTDAFVSLETANKLFGSYGLRGVQLRLFDENLATSMAERITQVGSTPVESIGWTTSQGSLFAAIRMEKVTVRLLLLSIVFVAAFNLISTLTMSVTEKRVDIAILQVLGFPRKRVMWLFVGHGLFLGMVGVSIGTLIGIWLAKSISNLSFWFNLSKVSAARSTAYPLANEEKSSDTP